MHSIANTLVWLMLGWGKCLQEAQVSVFFFFKGVSYMLFNNMCEPFSLEC